MSGISLGRSTIILLFSRVAGYPLALLNSVIMARVLGAEALGGYAYAVGLAALFGLVPNLGISTLLTRTMARAPDGGAGMAAAAIRAQTLLAGGVVLLIPATAALLPEQPVPIGYTVLAALQLCLGTLSWPYLAILGGRARYDQLAIVELATGVTGTAAVLAAAALSGTVLAFLWAHVVAAGIAVMISRKLAAPHFPLGENQPVRLGHLFRQAAPLGATAAVQSLYTRLDIVMLGQLASSRALGLYSAAYKPINVVVYFGNTVAGVLLPLMAQDPRSGTPLAFTRAMRGLWAAAPGMALAISGLAGPVLRALFGAEFASAAPMLVVLAWSAAANWLYAPLAISLQARDRERSWLLSLILATIVNALGNFWAIPRWGGLGAAGVTLASEAVLLVLGTGLAWRELAILPKGRPIVAGIAGATAGALVLFALAASAPFAATALALTVYLVVLVVFRTVSLEDFATVLGWIKDAIPHRVRG